MAWTATDLCNEAVDLLGEPGKIMGDINTDGTPVAETARRNYGRLLRALLRSAWWGFARKQAGLQLLGDATGQSASPVITFVEQPWTYAYAWPIDGVAGRWMPTNNNLSTATTSTGVPLTTNATPIPPVPMIPARFLVSSSDQYPIAQGQTAWSQMPDLQRTEGVGPTSRKVILTDQPGALFVYTKLVTSLEEWDDGFRQAMRSSMAVVLAPVVIEDPKRRLAEIARLKPEAFNAVQEARAQSANEAGMPQSVDRTPAWISARNGGFTGLGWGGCGSGLGTYGLYLPWEPFSLGGSVM